MTSKPAARPAGRHTIRVEIEMTHDDIGDDGPRSTLRLQTQYVLGEFEELTDAIDADSWTIRAFVDGEECDTVEGIAQSRRVTRRRKP